VRRPVTDRTHVAVSPRMAGAHVLIVEDDQAIQEVMQLILSDEGYHVAVADRPEAALRALRTTSYDLVLTDLFGATSAASLAAVRPLIAAAAPAPVGVCTGFALASSVVSDAGFAFMVPKPFDLEILVAAVAAALNAAGASDRSPVAASAQLRLPDTEVAL
jgi:DNA-binding response OmpR family regulator